MKISKLLFIGVASLLVFSCQKSTLTIPVSAVKLENAKAAESFFIGKEYQGGKIFWIDSTGQHGLITSIGEPETAKWATNDLLTNSTGKAIGTGVRNTRRIFKILGPDGRYGARKCLRYEVDGYDDWYLPSTGELLELYNHKEILGEFSTYPYWSSTEHDGAYAHYVKFGEGGIVNYLVKQSLMYVRPIRTF